MDIAELGTLTGTVRLEASDENGDPAEFTSRSPLFSANGKRAFSHWRRTRAANMTEGCPEDTTVGKCAFNRWRTRAVNITEGCPEDPIVRKCAFNCWRRMRAANMTEGCPEDTAVGKHTFNHWRTRAANITEGCPEDPVVGKCTFNHWRRTRAVNVTKGCRWAGWKMMEGAQGRRRSDELGAGLRNPHGRSKDLVTGLECDFECVVISKFIHIEGLEHVVRLVRSEVSRINAVSRVDRDEMGCTIYGIDVNNSDVSDIAGLVAWADNPHPSTFIRAVSYAIKPVHDSTWISSP